MKKEFQNYFIVTGIAIILLSCGGKADKANILPPGGDVIAVKTIPVGQLEAIASISSTGLLTTENEAKYAFKIGGVIDRITVNEGEHFTKGQVLATLKTNEIDAQLAQANLGYEKAKRDYTRANNLYKDSVYTLEQLQNTRTSLDIAQKTIEAILFNKKYANIYANANGFVTKKIANEGEIISSGMPVLAINEMSGSADWVLKVGVADKEWAAITIADKAVIILDAFPTENINATVYRKSQAADQSNGSFQVELKPDLENLKPAAGMFGKAVIQTANKTNLPTIPYDAIVEADGNNAFVFVPAANNHVKKIPVVIESFNNSDVIIKSGLENVSSIIISNSAFLNEKSIINIIK